MTTWTRNPLAKTPSARFQSRRRPFVLAFEPLEGRQLLAVTYQGGNILANVQVQGLYLGSDYTSIPTANQQTGYLDGFLKSVVNSSYIDALTTEYSLPNAPIGRGSFSQGIITSADLPRANSGYGETDTGIRSYLQQDISGGYLQQPDANRLYVVFVEANVAVINAQGGTSLSHDPNGFLGYHSAFTGTNAYGQSVPVRYAVIAYPGGPNGMVEGLGSYNDLTAVASHEIAEAVTDPDANYGRPGWYDNNLNGEVGDITVGQIAFLNGYAIQRVSDGGDQSMTPAGATSSRPVSFILNSSGYLIEDSNTGLSLVASGVVSIGGQGVDDYGQAMVDFITASGYSYEYHDGIGLYPLFSGAKQAEAGQGVSYELLQNGALFEVKDPSSSNPRGAVTFLGNNVASISAGTDRYGSNCVDFVTVTGAAGELSDTTGLHFIASGVATVSAGQGGFCQVLLQNFTADVYEEGVGAFALGLGGVIELTAGTDSNGSFVIDILTANGTLYEYRAGSGFSLLVYGVLSVGKARGSAVDIVLGNGQVFEHNASGWAYLINDGYRVS